jgi:hypothetical protein
MNALAVAAKWREIAGLPKQNDLLRVLTGLPSRDSTIFERSDPLAVGQRTIEATYTRPYQAHGSIGPSCAVAKFADGAMTVRTHTQGVVEETAPERPCNLTRGFRSSPKHVVATTAGDRTETNAARS